MSYNKVFFLRVECPLMENAIKIKDENEASYFSVQGVQ